MRVVFLDRDGVINVYRRDYVRTRADFEYYDGTAAAFRILGALNLRLVVVTNQSAIGRGLTTAAEVEAIHERLRADTHAWGGTLAAIEHCPHSPRSEPCECRKPGIALFERARTRLGLTFDGSYLVGDAPSDIVAGRRLGLITLRVATGRGAEPEGPPADYRVADLLVAARTISGREGVPPEPTSTPPEAAGGSFGDS